jgi:hypothetical protein
LLSAACYLLPAACNLLPAISCLQLSAYTKLSAACRQSEVYCLLPAACINWLLFTACSFCLLFAACCLFPKTYCLLPAANYRKDLQMCVLFRKGLKLQSIQNFKYKNLLFFK